MGNSNAFEVSITPDGWKRVAENIFTPEDVRSLWRLIRTNSVLPPDDKTLTFVSTTANIPTHEWEIYQYEILLRKNPVRFIVGDYEEQASNDAKMFIEKRYHPDGKNTFQYVRWDAHKLPIAPAQADIVWDRKGILWGVANSTNEALSVVEQYRDILAPGGSVLIDAYDDSFVGPFKDDGLYKESSTGTRLYANKMVYERILRHFDVRTIGEGMSKTRVLTKKD